MSSGQTEYINKLKRLAAINRTITTSLATSEVLRHIALSACELLEAKLCLVLLPDSDRCLHVRASSGNAELTLADFAEPMEETVMEKLRRRLALDSAEALTAVPIMNGYEVTGMLVVLGVQLSEEEQWMLAALADQAAIALGNARLHEMELAAAELERHRSRRALQEVEDRYRLMIEEVRDYAIFMIGTDQRVTTWNRGAERIFGYREEEILGQPVALIFTPADRANEIPALELNTAAQQGRAEDERWHVRKDGSRFWAAGSVTPLTNEQGELYGFVKVARDHTERKLAEEERERLLTAEQAARAEAAAANQLKDEFLATLSHELRSPLNSIVGYAALLQKSPEAQQFSFIQQAAATIQRNAQAQAQLVNDLLDLSRLQTGKLSLQRQTTSLATIIREVVESVRKLADEKVITLAVSLPADSLLVNADPVRVQQIAWNLITNALKFTPKGGHISISLSRDGDSARFVVQDTGQGIAPEFLPYVFEMFRQADASTTRKHGGLGIGLALVRQLTELHAGHVEAASAGPGRGARFTVLLPLPLAAPPAHPAVALAAPGAAPLTGMRVLVVDDTADSLELLRVWLTNAGALVETASSGAAALKVVADKEFDLIFSDIAMPEMDGYQFLRELRQLPRYRLTPAIALTGFGRAEDVARAQQAGFLSHLTKPLDFDKLVQVARAAIK
jgi:two-component system CheB/CheR fusion protein